MCLIYCWHKIDKPINIHQQIDKTQSHQLIDDYGYHQLWLFHIIPLDFPISSTVVCCTTKQSGVLRLLGHGAAQTAFAALLKGSVTRIFVAAIAICKNFDVFHSCCRVHRSVVHRRQKKKWSTWPTWITDIWTNPAAVDPTSWKSDIESSSCALLPTWVLRMTQIIFHCWLPALNKCKYGLKLHRICLVFTKKMMKNSSTKNKEQMDRLDVHPLVSLVVFFGVDGLVNKGEWIPLPSILL